MAVWLDRVNLGDSAESPRWCWCAVIDAPPQPGVSPGYVPRVWSGRGWITPLLLDYPEVLEAFERWQAAEIDRLRAVVAATRAPEPSRYRARGPLLTPLAVRRARARLRAAGCDKVVAVRVLVRSPRARGGR